MLKNITQTIALLFIAIFCCHCSNARIVKPLEKGQNQLSAHFGGPIILQGNLPVPLPLTTVSYAHGVTESFTAFGGIGLTAAAFGNLHLDVGGTQGWAKPKGWIPGFSTSVDFHIIANKEKLFFLPMLDANAYWNVGKNNSTAYFGLNNNFDPSTTRSAGELQTTHWLPSIVAGYTFRNKGSWNYTIELRDIAPFTDNVKLVPNYASLGQTGALGFYFAVNKTF